jgi:hypothetical protein
MKDEKIKSGIFSYCLDLLDPTQATDVSKYAMDLFIIPIYFL